jgi:hypothetical protein
VANLSPQAKAEILSGVLHRLEHMPEIWTQLPSKYQQEIKKALAQCSIWHEDLTPEDYRSIREWSGWRKL